MKAGRTALSNISGIPLPALEDLIGEGLIRVSSNLAKRGKTDSFEVKAIAAVGAISSLGDAAGIGYLKAARLLTAVFKENLGRLNLDHQFLDPMWREVPSRMNRDDAVFQIIDGTFIFLGKGVQFTTPGVVPYLYGKTTRSLLEEGDDVKVREIDLYDPLFDKALGARRKPSSDIVVNLSSAARVAVAKLRKS